MFKRNKPCLKEVANDKTNGSMLLLKMGCWKVWMKRKINHFTYLIREINYSAHRFKVDRGEIRGPPRPQIEN